MRSVTTRDRPSSPRTHGRREGNNIPLNTPIPHYMHPLNNETSSHSRHCDHDAPRATTKRQAAATTSKIGGKSTSLDVLIKQVETSSAGGRIPLLIDQLWSSCDRSSTTTTTTTAAAAVEKVKAKLCHRLVVDVCNEYIALSRLDNTSVMSLSELQKESTIASVSDLHSVINMIDLDVDGDDVASLRSTVQRLKDYVFRLRRAYMRAKSEMERVADADGDIIRHLETRLSRSLKQQESHPPDDSTSDHVATLLSDRASLSANLQFLQREVSTLTDHNNVLQQERHDLMGLIHSLKTELSRLLSNSGHMSGHIIDRPCRHPSPSSPPPSKKGDTRFKQRELVQEMEALRAKIDDLVTLSIAQNNALTQSKETEVTPFILQLEKVESERDYLLEQLSSQRYEGDSRLIVQVSNLQRSLNETEDQLQKLTVEKLNLLQTKQEMAQEYNTLLATADAKLSRATDDLAALKASLDTSQILASSKVKNAERAVDVAGLVVSDVEKQLHELRRDYLLLETALTTARQVEDGLNTEVTEQRQALQQLQQQYDDVSGTLDRERSQGVRESTDHQRKLSQLEIKNESLSREVTSLATEYETVCKQALDQSSVIDTVERQSREKDRVVAVLQTERSHLHTTLANLQLAHDDAERGRLDIDGLFKQSERQCRKLQSELSVLDHRYQESEQSLGRVTLELEQAVKARVIVDQQLQAMMVKAQTDEREIKAREMEAAQLASVTTALQDAETATRIAQTDCVDSKRMLSLALDEIMYAKGSCDSACKIAKTELQRQALAAEDAAFRASINVEVSKKAVAGVSSMYSSWQAMRETRDAAEREGEELCGKVRELEEQIEVLQGKRASDRLLSVFTKQELDKKDGMERAVAREGRGQLERQLEDSILRDRDALTQSTEQQLKHWALELQQRSLDILTDIDHLPHFRPLLLSSIDQATRDSTERDVLDLFRAPVPVLVDGSDGVTEDVPMVIADRLRMLEDHTRHLQEVIGDKNQRESAYIATIATLQQQMRDVEGEWKQRLHNETIALSQKHSIEKENDQQDRQALLRDFQQQLDMLQQENHSLRLTNENDRRNGTLETTTLQRLLDDSRRDLQQQQQAVIQCDQRLVQETQRRVDTQAALDASIIKQRAAEAEMVAMVERVIREKQQDEKDDCDRASEILRELGYSKSNGQLSLSEQQMGHLIHRLKEEVLSLRGRLRRAEEAMDLSARVAKWRVDSETDREKEGERWSVTEQFKERQEMLEAQVAGLETRLSLVTSDRQRLADEVQRCKDDSLTLTQSLHNEHENVIALVKRIVALGEEPPILREGSITSPRSPSSPSPSSPSQDAALREVRRGSDRLRREIERENQHLRDMQQKHKDEHDAMVEQIHDLNSTITSLRHAKSRLSQALTDEEQQSALLRQQLEVLDQTRGNGGGSGKSGDKASGSEVLWQAIFLLWTVEKQDTASARLTHQLNQLTQAMEGTQSVMADSLHQSMLSVTRGVEGEGEEGRGRGFDVAGAFGESVNRQLHPHPSLFKK